MDMMDIMDAVDEEIFCIFCVRLRQIVVKIEVIFLPS